MTDLLNLAEEQNRRWQEMPEPSLVFERDMVARLLALIAENRRAAGPRRAIVLSGLRRVGKTFVMYQVARRLLSIVEQPQYVRYFDLGDDRAAGLTVGQFLEQTAFLAEHPERKVLLLDEVGHDPNWTEAIKRIVDQGPSAPCVIVADSAAARLKPSGSGESALGRRMDEILEPLSFAEFARARGKGVSTPEDADGQVLGALAEEYLLRGGIPEHVLSPSPAPLEEVHRRLREDADVAVRMDANRVREIRDFEALRRTWAYVARGISLAINASRLSKDLGISKPTVATMLGLLRDILLVRELPVYSKRAMAAIQHPPRFVVADPGIAAAHLLQVRLHTPDEGGRLVEVAVARHLAEWIAQAGLPALCYARYDEKGRAEEVDFVVEVPSQGVIGIETKFGVDGCEPRLVNEVGLRARRIGATRALLVSRDPRLRRSLVDGLEVWSVPLWRMLHFSGQALRGELSP